MPPVVKYSRKDIIDVALKIVAMHGLDAINARDIANMLGCSVVPIFHNFQSMDELKDCVYEEIYNIYKRCMFSGVKSTEPYKEMGMSYIKFARDYPKYFEILLMKPTLKSVREVMLQDLVGDEVIKHGQDITGLEKENQEKFHEYVWIFTHGLACMIASNTINMSDIEIEERLKTMVQDMLVGFRKREINEKCN